MCGVGRGETPAVDVDGQVHGCLMFVDSYQRFPTTFLRTRLEAMRMGDLRDPQLPERLAAYPAAAQAAGIFHDKQDKYSSYGRCGECRLPERRAASARSRSATSPATRTRTGCPTSSAPTTWSR